MDLSKILSISGKPGLYKLVGEAKSNLVVESLIDGKRGPAFPHERISSLKEISIYAANEDVPLKEVFKNLHEIQNGKPVENVKNMDSNSLKALFEKVLPDYDKDAVYTSDMKKVFGWYNILLNKDLLDFSEEEENKEEAKEDSAEAPAAE
ncbi:MAG: DUF5606 domain-containing protein [Bacteroidales bacterium]|nr:DUF5606 domain-containing protein [Bacteroidales bacterium]